MNDKLEKLKHFYYQKKRLPTYTEMQKLFNYYSGIAVSWSVHCWIRDGYLKQENYQLVPTNKFFELPLLGTIKAGTPTQEEGYEESVQLNDFDGIDPSYSFVLRVSGDSMKDEGIETGDLVILNKNKEPKNGDIVAAQVDNEWTLKYYFKNKNGVKLAPANSAYKPIYPKESLEIGGVFVKLIKNN